MDTLLSFIAGMAVGIGTWTAAINWWKEWSRD